MPDQGSGDRRPHRSRPGAPAPRSTARYVWPSAARSVAGGGIDDDREVTSDAV